MLFGDADVKGALREFLRKQIEPGAGRHGRGDGDDLVVFLGLLDQRVGKYARIGRRVRCGARLHAGQHVELVHAVIFVGGAFGGRVAFALLGDDVDQHRMTVVHVLHVFQDRHEVLQIVAVDRADIIKAHFLEPGAAGPEAAHIFFSAADGALEAELFRDALAELAQRPIGAAGDEARKISAHGAGRRRDGHVVVVQDHDQARVRHAGIVHRLIGHARADGAVPDDAHDVIGFVLQLRADGEAEAGGNRGRGVRGAERVVLALRAFGETRQAILLAQGADTVAAPGDDLVRIGLVADVEDDLVVRRVEHIVQRHGQFDHAKTRAEVTAGHGDGVDHFRAQFLRKLRKLVFGKLTQIGRQLDLIEQWRGRRHGGPRMGLNVRPAYL